MIALEEGVITEKAAFPCDKSLLGCHNHPNATDLKSAIKMSCNPYFYQGGGGVFRRVIQHGLANDRFTDSEMGLNLWSDKALSFGLGQRLEVDIPNVKKDVFQMLSIMIKYMVITLGHSALFIH